MKRKHITNITVILIFVILIISFSYIVVNNGIETSTENYTKQIFHNTEEFNILSKEETLDKLNALTISEPKDNDYNRKEQFGGWEEFSSWSTRDEVLGKYGENTINNGKVFESGEWYILYTGETLKFDNRDDVANKLDIDHIVPLSYAYKHGADSWSQDKRKEFANDYGEDTKWTSGDNDTFDYENGYYGNLVVSDSYSNRSKSDKGPSGWMPNVNKLKYAEMWVDICDKYGISITQEDYDVLYRVISKGE